MLITLLIVALLSSALALSANSKRVLERYVMLFFILQACFGIWAVLNTGSRLLNLFTLDTMGVTYLVLMNVMALLTVWRSIRYLDQESLRVCKIYYLALIGLSIALTGVYLSNNITVTWIFLEATTIATAALTYHRRTVRSLEATWKYIFVSSVGIAIAYLGILLLSTAARGEHGVNLEYEWLAEAVANGNTLYMKLAFLFIIVGYSTKMELFPLYTVGVDANHASPAPASAFISSALVGGGFVAIFRIFRVISGNVELYDWVRGVLMVVALLSLLVAAVYMGRTSNYKRLIAYSTVENGGLTILALALGGVGIWIAVLHSLTHTLVKGVAFLQMSVVGRVYQSYHVGRIGGYFGADPMGALTLTGALVALMALPPSLLFVTEYMMLTELMMTDQWWWMIPFAVLLLAILYWLCSKMLMVLYKPCDETKIDTTATDPIFSGVLFMILCFTFVMGVWQAPFLIKLIDSIVL